MVSDSDSMVTLQIRGPDVVSIFRKEAGGHRWQRIPPTERGGRKHSSTITVAVLEESGPSTFTLDERDCDIRVYRASGPGGQKRNKVETAIEVRHRPTGIMAVCENERSRSANTLQALKTLEARIRTEMESKRLRDENATRKSQVGTGMRSDKIRTVQEQNDIVTNHLNGKKMPLKEYLKGKLEKLW